MVVILVKDKVADNVAAMKPVRQKMWLGDWTESSKEHHSLQQAIPKGYSAAFKMWKSILMTKLEGANGYFQVRSNQDVMGMFLLIHGICYEYNSKRQDTYAMMQAKKVWRYSGIQKQSNYN